MVTLLTIIRSNLVPCARVVGVVDVVGVVGVGGCTSVCRGNTLLTPLVFICSLCSFQCE